MNSVRCQHSTQGSFGFRYGTNTLTENWQRGTDIQIIDPPLFVQISYKNPPKTLCLSLSSNFSLHIHNVYMCYPPPPPLTLSLLVPICISYLIIRSYISAHHTHTRSVSFCFGFLRWFLLSLHGLLICMVHISIWLAFVARMCIMWCMR